MKEGKKQDFDVTAFEQKQSKENSQYNREIPKSFKAVELSESLAQQVHDLDALSF